jgi:pilus assembly protein Flp/PilA
MAAAIAPATAEVRIVAVKINSPTIQRRNPMRKLTANFMRDEQGVTAIEYGLIAALIAVIIIGAVSALGTNLSTTFSTVAGSL